MAGWGWLRLAVSTRSFFDEGSRFVRLAGQSWPRVRVLCALLHKFVRGFAFLRISLAKAGRGFAFGTSCCRNLSEGSRFGRPAGNSVSGQNWLLAKASRSGFKYLWVVSPTYGGSKKTFLIQVHIIDSTIKLRHSFCKFATKACPRVRRLCVSFAKMVRGFALWTSRCLNLSEGSRSAHLAGQSWPRVRILCVLLPKRV